jgi:two-component system chemotaxis response regulator CheY
MGDAVQRVTPQLSRAERPLGLRHSFVIRLPRRSPAAAGRRRDIRHCSAKPASVFGMKSSANFGMRILIADDQRSVGTTLAALVSHCHHEVVEVVGSGLEAIQAYDRHKPDVVLMDYYMAKLNGATACRNIVSKHSGARVILVSGLSPTQHPEDSGAFAILSKPVDVALLNKLLDDTARALS